MGVLDLDIATVEWMRGASDVAVVVVVGMWLRAAFACRLPDVVVWPTPGHERVPDVVDLSPVDAQDSTCMRRGGSLSAGQFLSEA